MYPILLLLILFLFVAEASAARFKVDAHVSHGVNTYNNKPIADLSSSSNIFSSFGRIFEIGVLNPKGNNASIITEATPSRSLMATIDAYAYQQSFRLPKGIGPFNIPIAKTPTLSVASQNINDRLTPNTFAESANPRVLGNPYLAQGTDEKITLKEWSAASARMTGSCKRGKATVRIQLRNGIRNAIYTLWDVGVLDPLTEKEVISAGPFGGLPNVMLADETGKASLVRKLNYCPFDKCPGAQRCTIVISLFYHFDHMVYGGSPVLDFGGQAVGHAAANQLQFFLNGDLLVAPQNRY